MKKRKLKAWISRRNFAIARGRPPHKTYAKLKFSDNWIRKSLREERKRQRNHRSRRRSRPK